MSKKEIKSYLAKLSKEELEVEIIKVIKEYKEVEKYFEVLVKPENEREILEEYKEKIKKQFAYRVTPKNPSIIKLKSVTSEYKKLSKSPKNLVELNFLIIQELVKYIVEFDGATDSIYNYLAKLSDETFKCVSLLPERKKYLLEINDFIERNSEYDDCLGDIFYDFSCEYFWD